MPQLLEGLESVMCMMDDILIYGQNEAEHDRHVDAVLQRIRASGSTLNEEKCHFAQKSIKFLGHLIDNSGAHPDPEKVKAIVAMKSPSTVTELQRFLGMVQQNE